MRAGEKRMFGEQRLTLSVLQTDVGGFIGRVTTHPDILDTAKERLNHFREKGVISDFHVLRCGSDINMILTHSNPPGGPEVRELAWNVIYACSDAAARLKLLRDDRDGIRGPSPPMNTSGIPSLFPRARSEKPAGPCLLEMEFVERRSEPVIILMATKTLAGSWNLPLYKVFADPFNTASLLSDPEMFKGFSFTVHDLIEDTEITLSTPNEMYSLLALISRSSRYVITKVARSSDGETAAAVSVKRLLEPVGEHFCSQNSFVVFRCHGGFPVVGETLEPFTLPHLVEGCMTEPHSGPLMPVPFYEATPTRFNGPPRMIGAGFHLTNGRLLGPHDMFDDPGFDDSRRLANGISDYLKRHGPFEPHQVPERDLYGPHPGIIDKIKERFGR
jgi:fructose 1,6-bisphosphate aldolase/phosphatase